VPTLGDRRRALIALVLAIGCGPSKKGLRDAHSDKSATKPGMEVHAASGRPRLSVVRRDGDPSAAIAIELRGGDGDELDLALASAVIGARLEAASFGSVEVIAGTRVARVRALVPQLGGTVATQLDAALTKPILKEEPAMAAARRALDAFAARPVADAAIARAARCLDRPTRPANAKLPSIDELPARAEAARDARIKSDAIVIGAVGSGSVESFGATWRTLPPLAGSKVIAPTPPPSGTAVTLSLAHEGGVVVIEGGPRAALPSALPTLVDPDGPLALRLRAADDFRLRGVSGAARAEGACVVIEVEPSPAARLFAKDPERFAMRAAVALEVARQEAELALESGKALDDNEAARLAISAGGDPREAADRAAWWSWPIASPNAIGSFATLSVPAAAAKSPQVDAESILAALSPKFALAVSRSKLAWTKNEIELRSRLEIGQGALWAALGSPCSVGHEGLADAGLASIAMRALVAAHATHVDDGVTIEPWTAATGVGLVAHAAPRSGESAARLAHRVGAAVGRAYLASFPAADHLALARAEGLLALSNNALGIDLVRSALRATTPLHPSWVDPSGTVDGVAKVGAESVDLRLATLRSGPLRIAVLANVEDPQSDATARAAERWVPRRPGESRACPVIDSGIVGKGAIHPLSVKAGTGVALAFPVDESQRDAAAHLALVLDGANGRLAETLGVGVATKWEARLVRGVGRHALVILALAPDANVDAVVSRVRALLEKLRGGAIEQADLARADRDRETARIARRLDPRARVVDLFAGELTATPAAIDLTQLRAIAGKVLDEDRVQLVVARLPK
jgi:hypothetical protein